MTRADLVVIGAGIVGLTIAREFKLRYPRQTVIVLEKEPMPGLHSSGRNSGVLHSGIYYPSSSLKAKVCGLGAREMEHYCRGRGLPVHRLGKVLVPVREEDSGQLNLLAERAKANGIKFERLDEHQLRDIEPDTRSATGNALLIPSTSVVCSKTVMAALVQEVGSLGIEIKTDIRLKSVGKADCTLYTYTGPISYGHVVNASGLHADRIAHLFGVGHRYTLLPFKGIYWKLKPEAGFRIRHLIYPVPDLRVPFLGVHTTTTTDGTTYLGPTAVPAFGRENYRGLQDISSGELARIGMLLVKQLVGGRNGFRRLAWQEGRRYFKPWFAEAASALLPRLAPKHLSPADKVGIRAQMLDVDKGELVTDFLVESDERETHVLNAISPAFTSAFPFARYVVDNYVDRSSRKS